jgi:hypothetical protein
MVLNNFIAISIVSCIFTSGAFIIPVLASFVLHLIVYCVITVVSQTVKEIKNPFKDCDELGKVDTEIETVFNEMKVILYDGKVKHHI